MEKIFVPLFITEPIKAIPTKNYGVTLDYYNLASVLEKTVELISPKSLKNINGLKDIKINTVLPYFEIGTFSDEFAKQMPPAGVLCFKDFESIDRSNFEEEVHLTTVFEISQQEIKNVLAYLVLRHFGRPNPNHMSGLGISSIDILYSTSLIYRIDSGISLN